MQSAAYAPIAHRSLRYNVHSMRLIPYHGIDFEPDFESFRVFLSLFIKWQVLRVLIDNGFVFDPW